MKVKFEVDCTPAEARAFLGLPDVTKINAELAEDLRERLKAAMGMAAPDELMKNWFSLGGQASDAFRTMMTQAMALGGGSRSGG
ncbi:MAG TPA: DUF6489 family protein [Caulobacteraceae bacterium]|jgi:hypothetical protein|nr:DUF6489 family protein [Caulobacteraceae bacterium]